MEQLEKKLMNLEEAKAFVETSSYEIRPRLSADQLRCIDDRENRQPDSDLPPVAIPGAGLGLVMDTLGAVSVLEHQLGRKLEVSSESIAKRVEAAIGTPSFHTDASHAGDQLACAGCGHCAGALHHPDQYLLSPEAEEFLEGYVNELPQRRVEPPVYEGSHNASGVMVVESPDIGLPSRDPDGSQVYVYHAGLHRQFLEQIAKECLLELATAAPDLKLEELTAALQESAQIRLGHTIEHLAADLPTYRIRRDERGQIEVTAGDR